MSYLPHTGSDRQRMLSEVGVADIDELFGDVPSQFRFPRLDLPPTVSEQDIVGEIRQQADRNLHYGDRPCFLGAGAWRHFRPATVDAVLQRGEFATSYTPYQPEISQGMLQAIFEYQSLICGLTGMAVSNASHYDGATSVAESVLLALHASRGKRNRVVLSPALNPRYRAVLSTYLQGVDAELMVVEDLDRDPQQFARDVDGRTAAIVVQSPDFLGRLHDVGEYAAIAHGAGALLIAIADPIALGIFKSPGEQGADIVAADGQPLGIPLNFGGPYLGIFATRRKLARLTAGRLVAETTDEAGKRGYVLTLSTREQHIRRARATSNICTNSALNALAAAVYLTTLGKSGLGSIARLCYHKSHYAADRITALDGSQVNDFANSRTFFRDFVVHLPLPAAEVNAALLEQHGIIGGYDLSQDFPELKNALLLSVTECNTRAEIDALVSALQRITA